MELYVVKGCFIIGIYLINCIHSLILKTSAGLHYLLLLGLLNIECLMKNLITVKGKGSFGGA